VEKRRRYFRNTTTKMMGQQTAPGHPSVTSRLRILLRLNALEMRKMLVL
jgi:hypothetical protein